MSSDGGFPLASQGISTIFGVAGAYQNYQAIKAQGEYERDTYLENARQAELQAADAKKRGRVEAQAVHRQTEELLAKQRVAAVNQGISPNFGSPLALQVEAKTLGAYDETQITNNAWREALGYQSQANSYRSQAASAKSLAKLRARSSLWLSSAKFAGDVATLGSMAFPVKPKTKTKWQSDEEL